MLFHNPFAAVVAAEEGEAGRRHESAVTQGLAAADANQAAPSTRAHNRSNLFAVEKPRKRITTRTRKLIDNHHLWSVDRHRWPGDICRIPRRHDRQQLPLQFLRIE